MAEQFAAVEDYLTCAVCLETFKEPVTLGCNHSFCSDCLHGYWDQNQTRNCPVCRRKSSKGRIIVNFALKELCVSFTDKLKSKDRASVCSTHPEVPPLFCIDEARLLCPLCEFSLHRDHTVVPVEQAERELKEQLQSQVEALRKNRAEAQALEQIYRDTQRHAHRQAELCERNIRAEFQRLHMFLKEEEELRLSSLREEQSRQAQSMTSQLDRLKETLASLEQNIQELEKQLEKKAEDFLLSYSPAQSPKEPPGPLPPLGPGLLLNQAKVLGNLAFSVWRKMGQKVEYSPVVLDPNTANPHLSLSDNLTSVTWTETPLQVPENPERFCKYPVVLGSVGFSSGRHHWDVEVGDHSRWIIGVTKESVNRKTEMPFNTDSGCFLLAHLTGKYITDSGEVKLKQNPHKVRVQLNCDSGTFSFYDSRDMSLIYIYKNIPKEKLFPCFCLGRPDAECKTNNIRICATTKPGLNQD
ncbi:nuclear factor 7, brain-like [Periophthalmus magnuspinnatus]|uniref:nuclear factor 7, brain-like n=1 Tax=Periophthalmus magnuspinnatus TaxID=409849 RepID=UPI00145B1103|nr:nuclear factor 7, brain-like [Periophthalmus magnuspinnatus]